MYSIINPILQSKTVIFCRDTNTSFFLNSDNTDYQQFVRDIKSGAQLNDAEGNPITGSALTTFMETLP